MAGYKVVSSILVIVMVVLNAQAQQPAGFQSDIDAIEAQARVYEVALANDDIEAIQNIYTEDCRVFPTGGLPYMGRESNCYSRCSYSFYTLCLHVV